MASIKVSEMPAATKVNSDDLIMIIQDGINKKVNASLVSSVPKINKIYTVRRALANNSSSSFERWDDAIGLVANATKDGSEVENDFDDIYPWSDIISYNYDATTQSITALYGEPGFSFTGENGLVLTRMPEFWWKRWRDDTYEYISISGVKIEGYIKSEQFSLGRYTNSGSASGVFSRSGYAPFVNYNITNARTYVKALGDKFNLLDWRINIIKILYLVEYADYNFQSKIGQGRTLSSNASPNNSGGCDTLGMKSGCLGNDGTFSVIYRGLEDIIGNVWQFIDGVNIKDYVAYVSYNPSDYAADKFDGSYKPLGYTNANSNGWQKDIGYDENNPCFDFPISVGGGAGSTTYTTDYYWINSGNRIARFGGVWNGGASCGLWSWHLYDDSSIAFADIGSRLLLNQ